MLTLEAQVNQHVELTTPVRDAILKTLQGLFPAPTVEENVRMVSACLQCADGLAAKLHLDVIKATTKATALKAASERSV